MKILAPVGVLAAAAAVAVALVASRSSVETVRPEVSHPLVDVMAVSQAPAEFRIRAQGTVEPRTESDLVAEVAGRVVWVSPDLASGGFFAKNDVLARIDARDYEISLDAARARLARAKSEWTRARSTLDRQRRMQDSGVSSKARYDDAVNAETVAAAGVREAEVAVTRAELDLERTQIRAPFDGRVRDKRIDVGQFISRGSPVARLFAVDYAEVRLPVSNEDAAFLDLPLGYRAPTGDDASADGAAPKVLQPSVRLSAEFAGRRHVWKARVVRTEGALDPRTRMITVVARVDDPYGRTADAPQTPLPIGLFVDAEIQGRVVENTIEIPRRALRERDQSVVVVDADDRLRMRRVDVLRMERDRVWIGSGLEPGERIVTTPIDVFVEGMLVRTRTSDARPEPAADGEGASS